MRETLHVREPGDVHRRIVGDGWVDPPAGRALLEDSQRRVNPGMPRAQDFVERRGIRPVELQVGRTPRTARHAARRCRRGPPAGRVSRWTRGSRLVPSEVMCSTPCNPAAAARARRGSRDAPCTAAVPRHADVDHRAGARERQPEVDLERGRTLIDVPLGEPPGLLGIARDDGVGGIRRDARRRCADRR